MTSHSGLQNTGGGVLSSHSVQVLTTILGVLSCEVFSLPQSHTTQVYKNNSKSIFQGISKNTPFSHQTISKFITCAQFNLSELLLAAQSLPQYLSFSFNLNSKRNRNPSGLGSCKAPLRQQITVCLSLAAVIITPKCCLQK